MRDLTLTEIANLVRKKARRPCPVCSGFGSEENDRASTASVRRACSTCGGAGYVENESKLEIEDGEL